MQVNRGGKLEKKIEKSAKKLKKKNNLNAPKYGQTKNLETNQPPQKNKP
jgi:hypothetical protein